MHKSIADFRRIIKSIKKLLKTKDFIFSIVIILACLSSYTLGFYQSSENRQPVFTFYDIKPDVKEIQKARALEYLESGEFENKLETKSTGSTIFGSKSGVKYYFSWCSGASRIKMQNRVYFTSEEEAKSKGRTLAKGCS